MKIKLVLLAFLFSGSTLLAQKQAAIILNEKELVIPFSAVVKDTTISLEIKKDEFLKIDRLICSNQDYQITSFTGIIIVNGDLLSYKSTNDHLPSVLIKAFNSKAENKKIWFEDVLSRSKEGTEQKLPSIVLILK
jgi:hypothetical protein